jgi:hypothetical protein
MIEPTPDQFRFLLHREGVRRPRGDVSTHLDGSGPFGEIFFGDQHLGGFQLDWQGRIAWISAELRAGSLLYARGSWS